MISIVRLRVIIVSVAAVTPAGTCCCSANTIADVYVNVDLQQTTKKDREIANMMADYCFNAGIECVNRICKLLSGNQSQNIAFKNGDWT